MSVKEAVKVLRDEMDRQDRMMPHMNWNRRDFERELTNLLWRSNRLDEMQAEGLRESVMKGERGND